MYRFLVTIHLFAAVFWLGSLFFLAAVGAPVLRKVEPPELRQKLFKRLGEAFRPLGWSLIVTLLVTGTLVLHTRGLLTMAVRQPEFWRVFWLVVGTVVVLQWSAFILTIARRRRAIRRTGVAPTIE